jgi:hypothetical protein
MLGRAREKKVGLDSKTGFTRLLHAREYRKAAKDARRYVEVVITSCDFSYPMSHCSCNRLHRAEPETMPFSLVYRVHQDLVSPACHFPVYLNLTLSIVLQDTIIACAMSVARHLYRCKLVCEDAFPSPSTKGVWVAWAWNEACVRADINPSLFPLQDEEASLD